MLSSPSTQTARLEVNFPFVVGVLQSPLQPATRLGLSSENKSLVMVLNKTRILSTDVISNGASYDLSYKVKENKIKIYLDSNNM